jgi:hypothetical protein
MTQTPAPLFINPDVDKARVFTINFKDGGALTASRGLIDSLFGTLMLTNGICSSPSVDVSVKSHARKRFIGGTAKTVAGYSYSHKTYPTTPKGARKGGERIKLRVNGEWWTARLSGSHQKFMEWICDNRTSLKVAEFYWKSEDGTNYGPIGTGVSLNP